MVYLNGPRSLKGKCLKTKHDKYRLSILIFAVSVHLLAAALCLVNSKKSAKFASSWAKQAKSTVNMERHRKRRCKLDPLFSI
jgi:cell division protein FtsX